MRFEIEGKEYEWDNERLTVGEARFLKEKTGMGILQWNNGLLARDGDAEAALIYFAKRRAGEAVRWQDLEDLNLLTLVIYPADQPAADEGEAKPERRDPTSTGGKTRKRATSATS